MRLCGDAYAVYPETLLFDSEALSLPVLKPAQINLFAAQSGTGLEDLLGAFGYTAYTDFYNEQDGTVRVFLDDTSTLRLNASGSGAVCVHGRLGNGERL